MDIQDTLVKHLKMIKNSPFAFASCNVESDETISFKMRDAGYTWVLDPIDGSRHLGRGLPLFTTSVALLKNDEGHGVPILGVIYAPVTKELFFAVEGCGAYLVSADLLLY